LSSRLAEAYTELGQIETLWAEQRELAERMLELRRQCATARLNDGQIAYLEELEGDLQATQVQLAAAQAQERLVSHEVCPRLIAEVISHWTGVPLSQLAREHNSKVITFASDLSSRVRGQKQAIEALDRAMRATAAGLNKPDAPVGVFLLVGDRKSV